MVAYGSKKSTATKKRKQKKKSVGGKRTVAEKRKKRIVGVKKPQVRKRIVVKKKVARARARASKKSARRVVPKAAAKKRKSVVRRPVPKKRARKPLPKKRARKLVSKKRVKKPVPKPTKRERRVRAKKIVRQVDARTQRQQKARGEPRKSPIRNSLREEAKRIEEERIELAFAEHNLKHGTGPEKRESLQENWLRLRKRWPELFKYAIRTDQTPRVRRLARTIDSEDNYGEQRMVRINRILTPGVIEQIMYKIEQTAAKFNGVYDIWYANMDFSGLGEKLFGSGNVVLKMRPEDGDDPDALFFQAQGHDNTGVRRSREAMLLQLESMLDDYATTPRTLVYLHHVKIMNFNRKRGRMKRPT